MINAGRIRVSWPQKSFSDKPRLKAGIFVLEAGALSFQIERQLKPLFPTPAKSSSLFESMSWAPIWDQLPFLILTFPNKPLSYGHHDEEEK